MNTLKDIKLSRIDLTSDLTQLYFYRKEAFVCTYGVEEGKKYTEKSEFIAKNILRIKNDQRHYYYITIKDKTIGALEFETTSIINKYGYVKLIIIAESFRSQGIGKKVMTFMDDHFKNLGLEGAILSVGLKNKEAFKFYTRNNWFISNINGTSKSTIMLKKSY